MESDSAAVAAMLAQAAKVPAAPIGPHLEDSDYVDYEGSYLSPLDLERVDDHIRSCLDCAAKMDDFCQAMQPWPASPSRGISLAPTARPMVKLPWIRIAAGVAIASLGLSGWLLLREAQDQQSLSDTKHRLAERDMLIQKLELEAAVAQPNKPPVPAQPEHTEETFQMARMVFELPPADGGERGGPGATGIVNRRIPENVKIVELHFLLSKEAMPSRYNLEIFDEGAGRRIFQGNSLAAQKIAAGPVLAVAIPKTRFRPGRYSATIEAKGRPLPVASYAFTILR